MAQFNVTFGVISGRGWVAIALVSCWDPCCRCGLLFAASPSLQLLQAAGLGHIPYQVFLVMPFVLTITAMAVVSSRNAVAPAARCSLPWREERAQPAWSIDRRPRRRPTNKGRCA